MKPMKVFAPFLFQPPPLLDTRCSGSPSAAEVRRHWPHLPHARGRCRHATPQENGREQAHQVRPAHPSLYFCNILRGYEDGWVEFMDKKKARQVAAMLNGQPLGSKNRGFYEHDLWTIKCAACLLLARWRAKEALTNELQIPVQVQVAALDRFAQPTPTPPPPPPTHTPSPPSLTPRAGSSLLSTLHRETGV